MKKERGKEKREERGSSHDLGTEEFTTGDIESAAAGESDISDESDVSSGSEMRPDRSSKLKPSMKKKEVLNFLLKFNSMINQTTKTGKKVVKGMGGFKVLTELRKFNETVKRIRK